MTYTYAEIKEKMDSGKIYRNEQCISAGGEWKIQTRIAGLWLDRDEVWKAHREHLLLVKQSGTYEIKFSKEKGYYGVKLNTMRPTEKGTHFFMDRARFSRMTGIAV